MERLDFNFIKDRDIGELIQDFFSLFKRIFKHLHANILRFLLPFLAIFLVLIFFIITPGRNMVTSAVVTNDITAGIFVIGILLILVALFFYFLFIASFGIEYIFLLKERGDFSFTHADVWKNIRLHLKKYFKFLLTSIVAGLVLVIPVGIIVVILSFIPLLGQLAIGIMTACITTIFICALLLYLQDKVSGAFPSLTASFRLIKKKILSYGLSAFLFRIILSICIGLAVIIPSIILGIIAFTTTGFNDNLFISFGGKLLVAIGSSILVLLVALGSIYMILFYCLIYFSSLESTNKEATMDQIDQIGLMEDE